MDTDEVSGKLPRPVALLAGITDGTEVFHRCWNGMVIGTENSGEMAFGTGYPGMRGSLV